MRELPLSKVYQLLEPGPVVLLTTARKGRANVMTMSWHMMVEFEPPQVACIVSSANYSFAALRATGECVIAIPARKLATKVVQGREFIRPRHRQVCGVRSDQNAGRARRAAAHRRLLCQSRMQGDRHALVNKYNLFILEVLKAWIDPAQKNPKTIHHHGYGKFVVDGKTIRLKSRMR